MLDFDKTYLTSMDFFLVFKGADIQPHSQWNLVDFFPNFKKNPNGFLYDWDHPHTSYMVMFSFNLIAIVCVIANLLFY